MGFQELVERRLGAGYKRLTASTNNEKKPTRPRRCRWLKRMNGRFKGFRIKRCRKLNWKVFSVVVTPKRISGIYADIVNRLKMDGANYPAIVFSCQWGLPVLSHSSVKCRKTAISFHRNPAFKDIVFVK